MNDLVVPRAGASARDSVAGTELTVRGETQGEALAARAQAEVYGAMQLALKRPRDLDVVRQDVLKACKRPAFAERARFVVPRGGAKIRGWSIRFAEELIRCLGNLYITQTVAFEDQDKRIVSVRVIDLESNTTRNAEVVVTKTIERRFVKDGQVVISSRTNSEGQETFLIEASDDEVLVKQNSAISKAVRNLVVALAPSDLLDEAEQMVAKALKGEFDKDPAAARKQLLDAFLGLNIPADEVKRYLGHDIGTSTPAELQDLRELYQSLRDGQIVWHEALEDKLGRPVEGVPCEKCAEDVGARKAALSRKTHDGKVLCSKCAPAPAAAQPAAPPAQEPKPEAPKGYATKMKEAHLAQQAAPAQPIAQAKIEPEQPNPLRSVKPGDPPPKLSERAEVKELLKSLNTGKRDALFRSLKFAPVGDIGELDNWNDTDIGILLEEVKKRVKRS